MADQTTAHVDTFVGEGLPPAELVPQLGFDDLPRTHPGHENVATELLDAAVDRWWEVRPCIADADISWTYAELSGRSNRLANVLIGAVVRNGYRILLRGPNTAWIVAAWLAVLKVGSVGVVRMTLLRKHELIQFIDICRPTLGLSDADSSSPLLATAVRAPSTFDNLHTAATDPALLGVTSTNTGTPKATIHFHRDLLIFAHAFQPLLESQPDDIFVGTPPSTCTFGLGSLGVFPMFVGASRRWVSTAHHATVCFTAPTAYRTMLERDGRDRIDLGSLRRGVSAGETLPEQTSRAFQHGTGLDLMDGPGATEMANIFMATPDDDICPSATGKPFPVYSARLVDDDGHPIGAGTIEGLAVRGPIDCWYWNLNCWYWNLTGDAHLCVANGYYHYQARTDDMDLNSCFKIAAPDVEHALLTYPAVGESVVIAIADEQRCTIVKAVVRLRQPEGIGNERRTALRDPGIATIAPYTYPRALPFVDEPLPRTGTGKLHRQTLADLR